MEKENILGMPKKFFYGVCIVLVIGIIIGSFYDYEISVFLSKDTYLGNIIQNYGNVLSHCVYAVAGICIYKGIRKKGEKYNLLAKGSLVLSLFWTLYSFVEESGKYLRENYGYVAGESSLFTLVLTLLTWLAIITVVSVIAYKIIDDEKANQLIAIGSVIIIGGVFSEHINEMLKEFGNRPRYKYLVTLDNPISGFKNWWEMTPFLKDGSLFESWPSGHMTNATIMFALPMLASVFKYKNKNIKYILFALACIWVIIMGYNRIHMDAHFLTDVCFGVLITYLIYSLLYKFTFSVFIKEEKNVNKKK